MKLFSSLFGKITLWFLVNLFLVGAVLGIFFSFQSQVDLHALLGRQGADRIRATGRLISHDLAQAPQGEWEAVLARHGEIHRVEFALFLAGGVRFTSKEIKIPGAVKARARNALRGELRRFRKLSKSGGRHRDREKRPSHDAPPGSSDHSLEKKRSFARQQRLEERGRLMMRTKNPSRYWSGTLVGISEGPDRPAKPAILLAVSDSVTGNGFFFDPLPWMIAAGAVVFISVLLWLPLVRSITGPLARMTRAAERIATGKYDVRIHEPRTDEIGRLAVAINHMTARLCGHLEGQKRFLGDVAHELGSPIARIRFGLGVLEQRVDEKAKERVADVAEDVDQLSNLVNELLSFSRAEMNPSKVRLEKIQLLPVIERAVSRESTPGGTATIVTDVAPGLAVVADPELLARALANLIRNAVKYAGEAGPIRVSALRKDGAVAVEVRDDGPGVAEDLVDRIFEPFFRPEPSRDRDSGGVGLGLAIVKTCTAACRGTAVARNLTPRGFAVTLTLQA